MCETVECQPLIKSNFNLIDNEIAPIVPRGFMYQINQLKDVLIALKENHPR